MKITIESFDLALGADCCMHAALHLVGFHRPNLNYSQSEVWDSINPAVVMLRERYVVFCELLDDGWRKL